MGWGLHHHQHYVGLLDAMCTGLFYSRSRPSFVLPSYRLPSYHLTILPYCTCPSSSWLSFDLSCTKPTPLLLAALCRLLLNMRQPDCTHGGDISSSSSQAQSSRLTALYYHPSLPLPVCSLKFSFAEEVHETRHSHPSVSTNLATDCHRS